MVSVKKETTINFRINQELKTKLEMILDLEYTNVTDFLTQTIIEKVKSKPDVDILTAAMSVADQKKKPS